MVGRETNSFRTIEHVYNFNTSICERIIWHECIFYFFFLSDDSYFTKLCVVRTFDVWLRYQISVGNDKAAS